MGGPKVVYAHAEGLAKMGYEVAVVCPKFAGGGTFGRALAVVSGLRNLLHGVKATPYYKAPGVETIVVPTISDKHVPDADIVIATGVQTAPWVRDLSASKGAKAYFLQHVETFIVRHARQTWEYPMAKITIAEWIK
ncbi:MAG: hypothetical protein R3284_10370, partial [Rubricoccaceae bacterium]|nr:hypothetical protein [Rubricoccaceae bacterium]